MSRACLAISRGFYFRAALFAAGLRDATRKDAARRYLRAAAFDDLPSVFFARRCRGFIRFLMMFYAAIFAHRAVAPPREPTIRRHFRATRMPPAPRCLIRYDAS